MTTKLDVYNDALLLCEERFLATLTDNNEPRRLLDQVWASGGVKTCLEEGQWHFAMRTVQIDYDTTIAPGFGYQHGFTKPDDWTLTSALCSDPYFNAPLTRYTDEAGYWYADLDTIYVRYVSDDEGYGNDLLKWPGSFREFVAAHFAAKIGPKLAKADPDKLAKMRKQRLLDAKNSSAMTGPTKFSAPGTWSMSRLRGNSRFSVNRIG